MRYDLILFDLDGTTLNTQGDLTASLNAGLRAAGLPERTEAEVRSFVGNGIRKMVQRAMPEGSSDEQVDGVCALFRAHYTEHCMDRTVPYEGILPLLRDLKEKGVRTAVVSNKDEKLTVLLCGRLLEGLPDFVVGSGGNYPRKPDPSGALSVLERAKVSKERTLYVGDSIVDVKTAENAGLNGLFVTWGFADADVMRTWSVPCADRIEELRAAILEEKPVLRVRPAEDRDAGALTDLLEQVLAVHHRGRPDLFKPAGVKYMPGELKEILADRQNRPVFVCETEDGKVVGHCFAQWIVSPENGACYERKELYIDDLCVDEKYRGMHVGQTLYRFMRELADANGVKRITLHVWSCNPGAEAFYRKMGMSVRQCTMEDSWE